jgi:hypothetical protein
VASGEQVRLTTKRGSVVVGIEITDSMQRRHVSNGLGLTYPTAGKGEATTGVAPNELTRSKIVTQSSARRGTSMSPRGWSGSMRALSRTSSDRAADPRHDFARVRQRHDPSTGAKGVLSQ